jgi:hypothetical protein
VTQLIVVICPKSSENHPPILKKNSRRIRQLMHKFDTLRSGYNYQVDAIRGEYYPKMRSVLDELEEIAQ